MKVTLKKQCGDLELIVEAEGKSEKEIFPQLEFWSALPKAHPSGATDFEIRVRPAKTRDGKSVKYYEITCPSVDQRFCFGQATDDAGGGLFPKGWQPIFHGDGEDSQDDRQTEQRRPQSAQPPRKADVPRQPQAEGRTGDIDAQIRALFKRLGVDNVGKEKMTIKTALNARVGVVLQELAQSEKLDLYEYLNNQAKQLATVG